MRVLALIPARGGSKGVPRKNLADLGGRPLVAWSIADALAARGVERVVVSTDSPEIAAASLHYGAEVPFLRPAALAADTTADLPVVVHALAELGREGFRPDALVLLRPTTPLRQPGLIDACLERLAELGADSVRSARPVGHAHPYWMLRVDEQGLATPFLEGKSVDTYYQRQLLPELWQHDGCCDVIRCAHLPARCAPDADSRGLFGLRRAVLPHAAPSAVNIDSPDDLARARQLVDRAAL